MTDAGSQTQGVAPTASRSVIVDLLNSEIGAGLSGTLSRMAKAHVICPAPVRDEVMAFAKNPRLTWSPDIQGALDPGLGRVLVFCERFEEEQWVIRRLHAAGRPSLGLFTAMAPGRAAARRWGPFEHGEIAPAPGPQTANKHYAIVGTPRVGSTFLCTALTAAGLGIPTEHLREAGVLCVRDGRMPLELFLHRVSVYAARNGIFGTRLPLQAFADASGGDFQKAVQMVRKLDTAGYAVFTLDRDPFDQAASQVLAQTVRAWEATPRSLEQVRAAQAAAAIGDDVLVRWLDVGVALRAYMDTIFANPPHMRLSYGEVAADPQAAVMKIARAAGITPGPGITPKQPMVRLGEDNPTYEALRERARALVRARGPGAFASVKEAARGLTGLSELDLERWPQLRDGLAALIAAARSAT